MYTATLLWGGGLCGLMVSFLCPFGLLETGSCWLHQTILVKAWETLKPFYGDSGPGEALWKGCLNPWSLITKPSCDWEWKLSNQWLFVTKLLNVFQAIANTVLKAFPLLAALKWILGAFIPAAQWCCPHLQFEQCESRKQGSSGCFWGLACHRSLLFRWYLCCEKSISCCLLRVDFCILYQSTYTVSISVTQTENRGLGAWFTACWLSCVCK